MFKNLLYSIFFHFLLIALIYANFNLKLSNETPTRQVSISLISKEDFESRFKTPKEEEKEKKSPKKKSKKKKQEKPESKSEVKSNPEIKSKEEAKPTSDSAVPVEEKPKKETKEIKKDEKEVITKEEKKEIQQETKKEEKIEKKADEEPEEKEEAKEDQQQEKQKDLEDNKSDKNEKIVNNLESLNLSFREKFNIRSQLTSCYKRALEENNLEEDKLSIIVDVEISKDGFITSDLEDEIDDKRYNEDVDYKIIINNVRRALEFCSPLRNLPLDKYDVWKQVSLEFGKIEESQKN